MKRVLIVAMFVAGAAEAATVAVWRGAGPNACNGACPLDWAMEQLPEAQRAQVEAALDEGGARPILVHRGDVFEFMTYQRGGVPHVDRKRTIAGMEQPARAWGWRFEGWSFVQLEACGNWAPVIHEERVALPRQPGAPYAPGDPVAAAAPLIPAWAGSAARATPISLSEPLSRGAPPLWGPLTTPQPPGGPNGPGPDPGPRPEQPSPPPPVATIPAPQGVALLIFAIGLAWARSRRTTSQRAAS